MDLVVGIVVGLMPVFVFLAALVFLDSYKLAPLQVILKTIAIGFGIALLAVPINSFFLGLVGDTPQIYYRYGAPIVEELLKVSYLVFLVKSKRVGFMVDASIYGFALGAGFAFVENIFYMQMLQQAGIAVWIVRGFGTALMHGGTAAIFGIVAKSVSDRKASDSIMLFLPALAIAVAIHSFYNHFFLSPILYTIAILVLLPPTMLIIFRRSEGSTRRWLGVGFDSDVDLLNIIMTENFPESPVGHYLKLLKDQFQPEIVVDMLCLLRIHTELSLRAKGILLARESGLNVAIDPEIHEKLHELKYLRKSIGATGLLAVSPILHTSDRDLWQLSLLNSE